MIQHLRRIQRLFVQRRLTPPVTSADLCLTDLEELREHLYRELDGALIWVHVGFESPPRASWLSSCCRLCSAFFRSRRA